MLPILKKRLSPIVIQTKQSESGKIEDQPEDNSSNEGLKQAFVEIVNAIQAGDMDAGADALKSFFEIVDSDDESSDGEES